MEFLIAVIVFTLAIRTALNFRHLGPVVQGPISANPGFNFNPGFYISLFKSRFGIILPIVFRAFTYLIVVKKK